MMLEKLRSGHSYVALDVFPSDDHVPHQREACYVIEIVTDSRLMLVTWASQYKENKVDPPSWWWVV